MEKVIGIGEYAVSNDSADRIKTFALASCVAVTAYSPFRKAAGMIHVALPYPIESGGRSKPGYYATTGVPIFIDTLCRQFGCYREELKIHLYGGAESVTGIDVFKIGRRNIEAITNVLTDLNLKVCKAETGGTQSRTIELDVDTGEVKVIRLPIKI